MLMLIVLTASTVALMLVLGKMHHLL